MSHAQIIKTAEEDGTIILKTEDGYSIAVVEIPGNLEPEEFFKSTSELSEGESYEDYHKCPHSSPERFDKFRVGEKDIDGKEYSIVYGRIDDTNKWEVASFSYPSNVWKKEDAKEHCRACHGVAFAKASDNKESEIIEEIVKENKYLVMKKDDMRHLVYGIVLEPNVVDCQGDYESEESIEGAAHAYLIKMWGIKERAMIGSEHEVPVAKAIPVQSYIAPVDFYYEGCEQIEEYLVRKGSWVLVTLVEDPKEFNKVKTGEYSGYSMQGVGFRRPV